MENNEKKYADLLRSSAFMVDGITHINFKPHPFTIGPEHLKKSNGAYLEADSAPCAFRQGGGHFEACNLTHAEHKSDKVLALQLRRNTDNKSAQKTLKSIADEMIKDGIDGIIFVDTKDKFRIETAAMKC